MPPAPRSGRFQESTLEGQALSHYKVEQRIGAGGMGVVYRALDTTLGRPVAIKVLPDHCAQDPERRARFEREARLLAALNHRNIAAIHGMESSGDRCFLVLELVPGDTLEQRLQADPPSVSEALRIAQQIAEAVEEAHERGIVHRDLKPANIKITPEGTVKVLDFGLAKAFGAASAEDLEEAATATLDQTRAGAVLGTVAYMSPEQARGKAIDKRTDIWAFGCVLYEMLAHRRAFQGQTASDFIAAILTQDPDWSGIPNGVPSLVKKLLKRCLQKEPQNRLRNIGAARMVLEDAIGAPEAQEQPVTRSNRNVLIGAAVGVVAGVAAAVLLLPSRTPPADRAVTSFAIRLGPNEVVAPLGTSVRLSQDGRRLVWAAGDMSGRGQLYTRDLDEVNVKRLDGASGAVSPFFSPDGRWVAYLHPASRSLKKVAISGGAPDTIIGYESSSGGIWTANDEIFMTLQSPGSLMRLTASGGQPTPLTTLDAQKEERIHQRPVLLPGGKAVLLNVAGGGMDSYNDGRIAVHSFATKQTKTLINGGMAPAYSSTGHLLYAREGKLFAVPFDLDRLEVTGAPVPVLDNLFMCVNSGHANYSLAENGTLAYTPGVVLGGERQLVWVDRNGKSDPIPVPPRSYLHPRLSPDGKHLAVEIEGPMHDFWSYDLGRGIMTKVSLEGSSHWPLWTPDGSRLTYRRWLQGTFSMWWLPADRSAAPQRLTDIGRMQSPSSWSPDGRVVAFTQTSPDTGADVYIMDMAKRKPEPFIQTRFAEGSPRFSSDGRFLAYTSNESGRNEIYVQAYPGPGAKVQVSIEGGTDPVWQRAGRELYYRDGDKMMVVAVATGGKFQAGKPKVLWTGRYAHGLGSACGPPGTTSSNYDVSPDGQRFLMIKHDEIAPREIHVIVNWTEELKRLMQSRQI